MTNPYANAGSMDAPQRERTNIYAEEGAYDGRFCGYVELGVHPRRPGQDGQPKEPAAQAALTFMLVNEVRDYGTEIGEAPMVITETVDMFYGDNAGFQKWFKALLRCLPDEKRGNYRNFAALAFDTVPCILNLLARTSTKNGKSWVYNNLRHACVNPPEDTVRQNGKLVKVPVEIAPCPNGPQPIFIWNSPTPEMWDGLHKWQQKKIKQALNYAGSPIQRLLAERGDETPANEAAGADDGMTAASEYSGGRDDVPF